MAFLRNMMEQLRQFKLSLLQLNGPRSETTVRLATHEKGNNIVYFYLMEACTSLVAKTYKGTWTNSLLKFCETRLSIADEIAL